MKRIKVISAVLCLSHMAAGCTAHQTTPASEPQDTTTAETAGESAPAHQVQVEDLQKTTLSDGTSEFTSAIPKLIVDGVEATTINAELSDYVQKNYPLEQNGDYVDGYETRYSWGVKDNTVSIVIAASAVCEDYFTCEVFNYDVETLTALEDTEVAKRLGMTDDDFFNKTADILNANYNGNPDIDLEKSIAQIDYINITPFITPDGEPGVALCFYYAVGSQFSGMESMRCFNMSTMERISIG